jgi:hypothetical protein
MDRSERFAYALAFAVLALGCAAARPPIAFLELPDAARSRAELEAGLAKAPRICAHSRPGYELCGWTLGRRDRRWHELASALETRRKVNVLCELPASGSAPAASRCRVYPRVSLPYEDARAFVTASAQSAEEPRRAAFDRAQEGHRLLESAATLVDLSHLVGDAPRDCLKRSPTSQLCVWLVSDQSRGYELVAATLGLGCRVRLQCLLAYDGAPRAPGSCRVLPLR